MEYNTPDFSLNNLNSHTVKRGQENKKNMVLSPGISTLDLKTSHKDLTLTTNKCPSVHPKNKINH